MSYPPPPKWVMDDFNDRPPPAPGAPTPRLKWLTIDDGWTTTTREGWEYRVRYKDGRFTSVRVTPTGSEAYLWACASLAQAKFSVFSDVRSRRFDP
jgi:hypothetical protein